MRRCFLGLLGLLMFLEAATLGLAGTWSANEFSYKPSLGARGEREKATYDDSLDRIDARLGKEVWVGDPKYGSTLVETVAALGAQPAILRVPAGTYNLADNLTLPVTLTLKPERGAVFAVADAKTLTINGSLEAGLYQIFSCTGTGKVVFIAGAVPAIYPQLWGASPAAAAAVNAAAIQASFTALTNNTSWTLPPGLYPCNASLIVGSYSSQLWGLTMDFKGQLSFNNCSGLDFRGVRYSNIKGIKVYRTAIDWTANNFGIKFGNMRRCRLDIQFVQNFTQGIYLCADGINSTANAYMTFYLGYIAENQYGIYVQNLNGGWQNEISYYEGQITSNRTQTIAYTNVSIAANTLTQPTTPWRSEWVTGYAVYFSYTALSCPAPLAQGTTYYVIRDSDYIIRLADTYAHAMAGTAIDLTSQGNSTLTFGPAGSWAVYYTTDGQRFDNHRWYGPDIEGLHNGINFAGYNGANQMFLGFPRFEGVANCIEAAPRNLTWIQGAAAIARADMPRYMPRMSDATGKSVVNIIGSGYYDLDAYVPYALPKESGYGWYNFWDLTQTTNLFNLPRDVFGLRLDDNVSDATGTNRSTSQFLNKGFQAAAAPASPGNSMSYAKNAVVWNTNVASGQSMGWVCSKSGSIFRATPVSGTGNLSGTALTMTTAGNTYYLFPGGFITINGMQHQVKAVAATSPNYVFTLYANNLGGDVTEATVAGDPPTWVTMPNYP